MFKPLQEIPYLIPLPVNHPYRITGYKYWLDIQNVSGYAYTKNVPKLRRIREEGRRSPRPGREKKNDLELIADAILSMRVGD